MDLSTLLPHKPPMILLTDVVPDSFKETSLATTFTIKESDVFYDPTLGGVPSYVSLEYMAQSIGVFVGLNDLAQTPPKKPSIGFVLGTRKLDTKINTFLLHHSYKVAINLLFLDEEMASFNCSIYDEEDTLCAEAIVNAYRPENPERYIEGLR